MMRHLDVPYYVGWLTAAALHGAAHHAPQEFQVAVSRHVADRQVGRTRFRFATRENVPALPVIERTTRSGVARVSSPEVTVLDLASDLAIAGGIDNAATVILGLAEEGLDVAALAELSRIFPAAAIRRTGWILETIGEHDGLYPLADAAGARTEAASLLNPAGPRSGTTNRRWSLRVNADVDAEF
jgi:predicted transcriptional regulator of viral defense system